MKAITILFNIIIMNWVKKHLKLVILGITFLIIVIIAIIDIKQIYVALTLIPSVLLSFLQSNNEKQEKLAEMQMEHLKKEQKEEEEQEKFRKMLDFTFKVLLKEACGEELNKIEQKIVDIVIDDNNFSAKYLIKNVSRYGSCWAAASPSNKDDMLKAFYSNLERIDYNGEQYIDILKQELLKILTPDVFDGEKLIVKNE